MNYLVTYINQILTCLSGEVSFCLNRLHCGLYSFLMRMVSWKKKRVVLGKFHSPDNSLLNFCSSPFRVEVQCQPQRGGTDRHEIHETAGY